MEVHFAFEAEKEYPYSARYIGYQRYVGGGLGNAVGCSKATYAQLLDSVLSDLRGVLPPEEIHLRFSDGIDTDLQEVTTILFNELFARNRLEDQLQRIGDILSKR